MSLGPICLGAQCLQSLSVFAQDQNSKIFNVVQKIQALEVFYSALQSSLLVTEYCGVIVPSLICPLSQSYPTACSVLFVASAVLPACSLAGTLMWLAPTVENYFAPKEELADVEQNVRVSWGKPEHQKLMQLLYCVQLVQAVVLALFGRSSTWAMVSALTAYNLVTTCKRQWVEFSKSSSLKTQETLVDPGYSDITPLSARVYAYYPFSHGCSKHPTTTSCIDAISNALSPKFDMLLNSLELKKITREEKNGREKAPSFTLMGDKFDLYCCQQELCSTSFPDTIKLSVYYKMGASPKVNAAKLIDNRTATWLVWLICAVS